MLFVLMLCGMCKRNRGEWVAKGLTRHIALRRGRARAHGAPAMDLARLDSVAAFARQLARQLAGRPLHCHLANAGANFMGARPWARPAGVAGIAQARCCCGSRTSPS